MGLGILAVCLRFFCIFGLLFGRDFPELVLAYATLMVGEWNASQNADCQLIGIALTGALATLNGVQSDSRNRAGICVAGCL